MYSSIVFVIFLFSPVLTFNREILKNRFNRLVIFGDSYFDTGNVYELTNRTYPISPPYYRGRYSNGRIWVDRLKVLCILNNAYGSATTDNNLVIGRTKLGTIPVPGVRQQVATYLSTTQENKASSITSTLHIISGGGNDFVFNNTITPLQSVNSLMNSVRDLLNAGFKHILVFNQLPIQLLPYSKRFNQPELFIALTNAINSIIVTSLVGLQQNYPNAQIYMFDFHAIITKIVSNNSSIKFTNTNEECWTIINFTTVAKNCSKPNEYVFLDNFHFTTPVNQLIADAIQSFLSISYNDNDPNSYFRSF